VTRRTITYGTSAQAELTAGRIVCGPAASSFELHLRGKSLGEFHLPAPGAHNVLNATAAVAVALELEVAPPAIREALAAFTPVERRFQLRGRQDGVTVIDDYGHHPTEIRATLDAARLGGYRRVHVLFQPHRYTRTQQLMDEFGRSFHQADSVLVLDIYAASEKPIEGVSAAALAGKIRAFGHRSAEYAGGMAQAVEMLLARVQDGDAVLTLGAGNIWQAGDLILERLRGKG
jgi:UDP-N-acetylmuramate--alanine ligase